MALQSCGDFANNQVIHLLGGFWIVSAEAKTGSRYPLLVVPPLLLGGAQRCRSPCLGLRGLPRAGPQRWPTVPWCAVTPTGHSHLSWEGTLTGGRAAATQGSLSPSPRPQLQGPRAPCGVSQSPDLGVHAQCWPQLSPHLLQLPLLCCPQGIRTFHPRPFVTNDVHINKNHRLHHITLLLSNTC